MQRGRRAIVERAGRDAMELSPAPRRQRLVDRGADQRVEEAQRRGARDQPRSSQRVHRSERLVVRETRNGGGVAELGLGTEHCHGLGYPHRSLSHPP